MLILSKPPRAMRHKSCCGNCKGGKPCCGSKPAAMPRPRFRKQGGLWLPDRPRLGAVPSLVRPRAMQQFPAEWGGRPRWDAPLLSQEYDLSCLSCCAGCPYCCIEEIGAGPLIAVFDMGTGAGDPIPDVTLTKTGETCDPENLPAGASSSWEGEVTYGDITFSMTLECVNFGTIGADSWCITHFQADCDGDAILDVDEAGPCATSFSCSPVEFLFDITIGAGTCVEMIGGTITVTL